MKHFLSITSVTLLAMAPAAFAQKWEVGVAGGGSFSTSQTIKNAIGDANGGFSPGLAVSAWQPTMKWKEGNFNSKGQ